MEPEILEPQFRTRMVTAPITQGGAVKLSIEQVVEEVPPPMFPAFDDPSMEFDPDYM